MNDLVQLGVFRAEKTGDNGDWSPAEALRSLADDIENGDFPATAVFAVALNMGEDGEDYLTRFAASNLRGSEMLALIEYQKAHIIDLMTGRD